MRRRSTRHPGYINALLALFCTYLLCLQHTRAGEVLEAFVDNEGDHYILHLDMRIDGTSESVYAVLLDFENLHRINDSIKYSERRNSTGKVHLVYFSSEGCVLFFCRRVNQLVTVTELEQGYIMSVTDPAHSDLQYGRTLWQIIDEGETTRIKYNAEFVPDFWVPPLFGSYIFKKRMLKEGQKTVHGIERLITSPTE